MNILNPSDQKTILFLLGVGMSQREIAKIVHVDRKTIRSLVKRASVGNSNSPLGIPGPVMQVPPPMPLASTNAVRSACEPHRAFIIEQLRLGRSYSAIYQDLVAQFGFLAGYNSVKRFAGRMLEREWP